MFVEIFKQKDGEQLMGNVVYHVKCYVCDRDMVEHPNKEDTSLHFFDCPNHCPGSQRIVCENTMTQKELDEQYEVHKQLKNP